jgi:hypothetical protein
VRRCKKIGLYMLDTNQHISKWPRDDRQISWREGVGRKWVGRSRIERRVGIGGTKLETEDTERAERGFRERTTDPWQ